LNLTIGQLSVLGVGSGQLATLSSPSPSMRFPFCLLSLVRICSEPEWVVGLDK
jgi:hypothetical protein